MVQDHAYPHARRLITVIWLTYFFYYIGRLNLSAALDPLAQAQNWSRAEVGILGSAMLWAYAAGQIIAGQLGSRFSPRLIVAIGLLLTATANLLFSLQNTLVVMAVLAAVNGLAQAAGWGPMLRIVSERLGAKRSQGVSVILSLSYQSGAAFSIAFAGVVIALAGWRAGFAIPGVILLIVLAAWWRWSDDAPPKPAGSQAQGGIVSDIRTLLPVLIGAVGMGFVFNGILLWTPTYLADSGVLSETASATLAGAVPLLGAAGMVAIGALLRRTGNPLRLMQGSLMVIAVALMGAVLTIGVGQIIWFGVAATALGASVALLLGAIPLKLAAPGRAASAAGLVTAVQNIGGGLSGFAIGGLTEQAGWTTVFAIWVGCALVAIFTTQWALHQAKQRDLTAKVA